jgi:hypothetical protein
MGVATAVAVGGLAISAASTTASFVQAGQQKKKQRQAEADAAAAMAEARKKLEVNFAENRSIQKEPYELAREAILSSGAQALQQGVESDRGAEVTAGKVQMAMNQGQGDIRTAMGQEMTDIEKDIINEQSRLRDLGVQLDLGEVEGAQLAARDAQEAATAANMEGFQGLTSTLQQGLDMVPLYQKTASANQLGKMQKEAQKLNPNMTQADFQKQIASMSGTKGYESLAGVGGMDPSAFNATMGGYSKQQLLEMQKRMQQARSLGSNMAQEYSGFLKGF